MDPVEDELVKKRATPTDCTPDPKEGFSAYNLSWFLLVHSNRSLYCHLPATSKVPHSLNLQYIPLIVRPILYIFLYDILVRLLYNILV